MQTWIAAKDITKDSYLLNARLEHIKCVDVKTVSIESTVVYQVSTTMPHTFFVTEQEILTHNFFPVILGVSWLFGLGSVEFAGFNIAAIIGGAAIGIKLFKSKKHKHHKSKIVVKPHIQGSIAGNGGNPDPNDDDEEKDQQKKNRKFNNISKSEFFKKVKDQYEYWKDGLYRRKHGAKGIEDAEFLKWDHLHGDVEAYSKGEIPLGSIDPRTLKIYKAVSKYRRML